MAHRSHFPTIWWSQRGRPPTAARATTSYISCISCTKKTSITIIHQENVHHHDKHHHHHHHQHHRHHRRHHELLHRLHLCQRQQPSYHESTCIYHVHPSLALAQSRGKPTELIRIAMLRWKVHWCIIWGVLSASQWPRPDALRRGWQLRQLEVNFSRTTLPSFSLTSRLATRCNAGTAIAPLRKQGTWRREPKA